MNLNSFNINYFIHAANILLLAAYSVRDILWLRLFAVASSVIAIPYFLFQPHPLWAPLAWSILFTLINLYQSWRLLLQRRPIQLTSEEEEVRRLVFEELPPRKVLEAINIGSFSTTASGELLMKHGSPIESIPLIVRGKVQIKKEGRVLGELGPGDLVGSALLLTGDVPEVDAVAVEPVRILRWEADTMQRYLSANPDTRSVLQRHLSHDLASKLTRLGRHVSDSPYSAQ